VKHCSIYSPSIILNALLRGKQALNMDDNMNVTIVLEYCATALGELIPTLILSPPCVRFFLEEIHPHANLRMQMFLLMNDFLNLV
jgi:hypothetical protein